MLYTRLSFPKGAPPLNRKLGKKGVPRQRHGASIFYKQPPHLPMKLSVSRNILPLIWDVISPASHFITGKHGPIIQQGYICVCLINQPQFNMND